MTESPDILIVGGGPAGSAAAALLARAGRRVAIVEKDRFPRDKLCGEFLSGEAQPLLERLGCLAEIEAVGPARITRWRFTAPSGRMVEGGLPRPALGLSRLRLDSILFRHARACGAVGWEGVEARRIHEEADGTMTAQWAAPGGAPPGCPAAMNVPLMLAAWGRRAAPDRFLDRGWAGAAPYIGVKRHLRFVDDPPGGETAEALAGVVEIHAFRHGYCGLSMIEEGRVNVCMLLERAFWAKARINPTDWDGLILALGAVHPVLARRFRGLEALGDRALIVSQPAFGRRAAARGGVLFLGDAAGMIPPLCGDGQAMALSAAEELGRLVALCPAALTPADVQRLGEAWRRRWRRSFGRRVAVGRALQNLMGRPWMLEWGLRFLNFMPFAASGLVRATRGA